MSSDAIFDERNTLTDLARRHNVALYFVSLAPVNLFNWSAARVFAEETDGRNMVSNDIAASLDAVLDHQTGFYMLGYRSTAGESGRKPRTVRVKTTKSGVNMDVRRITNRRPRNFSPRATNRRRPSCEPMSRRQSIACRRCGTRRRSPCRRWPGQEVSR